MEFHVYLNGARRGPFTEECVQAFLDDGLLLPTDLAAAEATSDWRPLSAFRRFQSAEDTTPDPAPGSTPNPSNTARSPTGLTTNALGPYARSTLAPNEQPFHKTSLHWFIFVRYGVAALALFIFAAVPFAIAVQALTGSELGWFVLPFPAFLLVAPTVSFFSNEIVITDRRVLIKTGVVQRQTAEMFISKVESISVDQGFLARMFDFGTVRIRGTGGFEETFDSIARPLQFRNWVQRLQSGETPEANEPAVRPSSNTSAS